MTNVEALRLVYIALGGDAEEAKNYKDTAAVIYKIAELVEDM